ncbi:MAG: amino acid adenylation domain-containing protein [Pyrinomonadaceae bacterium]
MAALLHRWVSEQAERQPDATALVMRQQQMTYEELELCSNRLARLLKQIGCERGDRVCLLTPKSPAAIVSLLGALKADCIYVPLDAGSPAPRLAKIVDACKPKCILATTSVAPLVQELLIQSKSCQAARLALIESPQVAASSLNTEFSWDDLATESGEPLHNQNDSRDPAHILFTSGSTGTPKGVVITHENVRRFIGWAISHFGTNADDRISGHPPLHFDLSTFDIFGTFAVGAQLHLVPVDLNLLPNKLAEFIRGSQLTQWFSVPSVLNYMAKLDAVAFNDFPSLKRLIWCGEVFPTPALTYWMKRLPGVRFTNLYGPTEATIASSYYDVPSCPISDTEAIPIGTACNGEELLVLDEQLQPVPPGEIGDLYIRGVGLSPGYWCDTEKTEAAFLPNPKSSDASDRIYKTGDLAKVGLDTLFYYLGRADSQIKSRGYRIELGEIEIALNSLNMSQECGVVAVATDGFEGVVICCAYVPLPSHEVTPAELRGRLRRTLPGYMLPVRWLEFDSLPKNVNGKIDRPRLRELFQELSSQTLAKGATQN